MSLVVCFAMCGAVAMASPAGAGPQRTAPALKPAGATYLSTHGMWLRSTTGLRIFVSVFVDRYSWGRSPDETIVEVDLGKGDENHNWGFENGFPNRHFSFSRATGRGRLLVGSPVMGKFGRIDLNLAEHGPTTRTSCGGGVAKDLTPVTVRGQFRFNSRSAGPHRWGALGALRRVTTFTGRNVIETDYGSPNNACFDLPDTCTSDANWAVAGGDGVLNADSYVENGKRHGYLAGFGFKNVGGPTGPERDDFVIHAFPVPHVVTSSSGESVTAVSQGRPGVIGSATLASVGAAKTYTDKCSGGTISNRVWHASYTNGDIPLELTENIGAGFVGRNSAHGAYIGIGTVATQPAFETAARPAFSGPAGARAHEIRRTTLAQWRARG
jgi:hypothetical protein